MGKCRSCNNDLRRKVLFAYRVNFLICDHCKTSSIEGYPDPLDRRGKESRASTEDFYARLAADAQRNQQQLKFRILVWGPTTEGKTNPCEIQNPSGRKRLEIKLDLLAAGHDARFSEDFTDDQYSTEDLTLHTKEFIQITKWKQYLIMIVDSPGSIGELTNYWQHMDENCLIWHKEGRGQGYVSQATTDNIVTQGGKIEEFTEADLAACVVKKMSEYWIMKQQQCQNALKATIEALSSRLV